jgi:hypothetical protein
MSLFRKKEKETEANYKIEDWREVVPLKDQEYVVEGFNLPEGLFSIG